MVSSIFYFYPYQGRWSNLTNIFQRGWNHQPVKLRVCIGSPILTSAAGEVQCPELFPTTVRGEVILLVGYRSSQKGEFLGDLWWSYGSYGHFLLRDTNPHIFWGGFLFSKTWCFAKVWWNLQQEKQARNTLLKHEKKIKCSEVILATWSQKQEILEHPLMASLLW